MCVRVHVLVRMHLRLFLRVNLSVSVSMNVCEHVHVFNIFSLAVLHKIHHSEFESIHFEENEKITK